MTTAVACVALLGLLVIGLGFNVSIARGKAQNTGGQPNRPDDPLFKAVRAHGNAVEYAPMLAILMFVLGSQGPAGWLLWVMVAATLSRYLHAVGMLMSGTLEKPQPLRVIGAMGTYLTGVVLSVALLI
ncbi:MAPEG family protein [Myxococcota bacterium]|nr:MAPEG family protein [Myxococcota bacterium]